MRSSSAELAENLARVRERIERAASRAGRRSDEITLIAVSKMHSVRKIQELYEAGVRHFGENRVQERESKAVRLSALEATWHMIGHLQKNKAARAAELFDTVDTVDSAALAEKLERARIEIVSGSTNQKMMSQESQRHATPGKLRALIEMKLDPEPAKSGIDGKDLPRLVEAILRLPHLELSGLMGVPPYFDDPEDARPHFRRLRELRDTLRAQMGRDILPVLSMGMSHDLEVAIEEGATEVRVGSALFGARESA